MRLNWPELDYSLKQSEGYQDLKYTLHGYLIERLEEDKISLDDWERERVVRYVREYVAHYAAERQRALTSYDIDELTEEVVDELTGYGPIERLLADDQVSDILVNGARYIFVERGGVLDQTDLRFINDEHVLRVIRRMLAPLGRRLDEANPMVDARLPDGSRVNAIVPPLALEGPCLSVRKFRKEALREGDLIAYGAVSEPMVEFLRLAVQVRCNIVVSGGTGAGKTTLLNILGRFIDRRERLVTIEDAAELQVGHHHVVRLETRPPNVEGQGEVRARELVRNALRMRPDRIILGEIRGEEVMDMLQSMNTGHDGSMSTVHANGPRDALTRLEMLAGLAGFQGGTETLRQMIATAVDVIVQVARFPDGRRRVISIEELIGLRDGQFVTAELFRFDRATGSFTAGERRLNNAKFHETEGLPEGAGRSLYD